MLLVAHFVAREQAQIVQQLVDVDRAQFRLGAAGKIQDLLHDFVQVLHFLAQDGVVLDPRIARRELQAEGMVEHFHDGERIADFVGDFGREQAEGGKFFILTQLLLDIHDALVEAGLFHGHGRQFGQGAQDVDFLVGKTAGLRRYKC